MQGLIRSTRQGYVYDTVHPEEYWQEVSTDEEFMERGGSMSTIDFNTASEIVEAFTGKKENVIGEVRKIFADSMDFGGVTILNKNGKQYIVPTGLPRKKGQMDDLFVFKKIAIPSSTSPTNS